MGNWESTRAKRQARGGYGVQQNLPKQGKGRMEAVLSKEVRWRGYVVEVEVQKRSRG